MSTQYLENKKIKLRALEPEDLDLLYKWENDTGLWIHGNNLSPYSKLTLRQYITDSQSQDIYQSKQLRLMIINKSDDQTIGTIDLYDFDIRNSKIGIGILIHEKARNKSFATMTIELIKNYVFSFLNIHQIYAYVSCKNEASIKLFNKVGFKDYGLLKDWIYVSNKEYQDVYIYQLINKNE